MPRVSSGVLDSLVRDTLALSISSVSKSHPAARAAQPWLVGFSGGLDSTVLLHACCAVMGAGQIVALHIHHGLQPGADQWQGQCELQARALGVRLVCHRVAKVPQHFPDGIENWARDVRREVFKKVASTVDARALLLAHHADDQVETVLLQLLRGAGPQGLAAMQQLRQRDGLLVIRPLLELARTNLEAYARTHALSWITDASNRDTRIRRNQLRHKVLPAIQSVCPEFAPALLRTAENAQQTMQALHLLLFDGGPVPDVLSRARLRAMPAPVRSQALRLWLQQQTQGLPGRARLAHMLRVLVDSDSTYARVDHAQRSISRYRDRISCEPLLPAPSSGAFSTQPATVIWSGEAELQLPGFCGRLLIDAAPVGTPGIGAAQLASRAIAVEPLRMGARMRTHRGGPNRLLRNLCQERAIARWSRASLPMLSIDSTVLFSAGIGINAHWLSDVEPAGSTVVLRWQAG